jgi:hypothetical protein
VTSTITQPFRLAHPGGLLSDQVRQSRRISHSAKLAERMPNRLALL